MITQATIKPLDTVTHSDSATSFQGPNAVELHRLIVLKNALGLEIKCPGLKLSRGMSALAIAKQTTGLKSNKREKHIERIEIMIQNARAQVVVVDTRAPRYVKCANCLTELVRHPAELPTGRVYCKACWLDIPKL